MFRRLVETCATGRSVLNLTVTETAPQGDRMLTEFDMDKLTAFWSLMVTVYVVPSMNKLAKTTKQSESTTATASSTLTTDGVTVELEFTLSHTHGATEAQLRKIITNMISYMHHTTEAASKIKRERILMNAFIGISMIGIIDSLLDYVLSGLGRPKSPATSASEPSKQ